MSWLRRRMGWDESAEIVQFKTRVNIATYNLQIFTPPIAGVKEDVPYSHSDADKRMLADLPAMLEHIEEEIQRLLPEGYEARITEWDK